MKRILKDRSLEQNTIFRFMTNCLVDVINYTKCDKTIGKKRAEDSLKILCSHNGIIEFQVMIDKLIKEMIDISLEFGNENADVLTDIVKDNIKRYKLVQLEVNNV